MRISGDCGSIPCQWKEAPASFYDKQIYGEEQKSVLALTSIFQNAISKKIVIIYLDKKSSLFRTTIFTELKESYRKNFFTSYNFKKSPLMSEKMPDLIVKKIHNIIPYRRGHTTIDVTVKNVGIQTSPPSHLRVTDTKKRPRILSSSKKQNVVSSIKALEPGEEITVKVILPYMIHQYNFHFLKAEADYTQVVKEKNEDNNITFWTP